MIGAFYLTEKVGAADFGDDDEELIELLAAHAAIAIANARLYEQSRELSILAERNRLALDLHDAVSQKLFGLVLNAEAAGTLLERDPAAAREQVARAAGARAGGARRAAVARLRAAPARPRARRPRRGAAQARRAASPPAAAGRSSSTSIERTLPRDPARDREVLRIAQEALQNALRHANARAHRRPAAQRRRPACVLEVEDDGAGFDPTRRDLRVATARPDVDGGARGAARRAARDPLGAGRGHDRAAGGRCRLTRSACSSSTTTPSSARGCARSSTLQDGIEVVGRGGRRRGGGRRSAERLRPDVVLMDLVMPRLDGVGGDARAARAASRARG